MTVAVDSQFARDVDCDHDACAEYAFGALHAPAPNYTAEDECEGRGHPYYGDEWNPDDAPTLWILLTTGRCYCGARRYVPGGSI